MPLVSQAFGDIITFTRASTGSYFDSAGVLQSAATNAPRLDYNPSTLAAQGLLIEEARTNGIRNNTMQGASAGVAPTNWSVSGITSNGITVNVQGTGTENGIQYVDLEITGTATLTGTALTFSFEPGGIISASPAQVWAWSSYLKFVSGSLTNLTLNGRIQWRDSTASIGSSDSSALTPTTADLATQRLSFTGTAVASTAFVQPQIRIGVVNGVTYNAVIRIGLPQLEQGAFATSVIPTTTAALTRAADVASVNTLSPWYNAAEGTVYAESAVFNVTTQTQLVWQIVGGANSTSLRSPQITGAKLRATVGNTFSVAATGASITNNTFIKSAVAWQGLSGRLQSGAVGEDITAATTVTGTQLNIGNLAGGSYLNGYISRLTYYPRRLTNAELQTITT